ncbi:hypothetical protein ACFOQM_04115 [Paenibacillus sp. GCM10012307]|uniref:Uncharacterized protein n=1 Tax=Paenibacillus roseus TaxID=2798579 RepID=A0A934J2X8_9BACL|nr:hypothetical protein [Paenibacillus roseus]MBJ6360498.1 hypothetical protein [Paenibacillus roseus]
MKIYCSGIDPQWTQMLRDADYETVMYQEAPGSSVVANQVYLFSSRVVSTDKLEQTATEYPDATLIYSYQEPGIAGWRSIQIMCQALGIKFLRPGIGQDALIQQMDIWFQKKMKSLTPMIGVFGVVPGIGCTSIAALLAKHMPSQQKKVLLGLNLFNPGWHQANPNVSLDGWRMRMIQKMMQPADTNSLIYVEGVLYLPGNADPLITLDYAESEFEHLTDTFRKENVLITDNGAIPHSAAWVSAVQRSDIRIMVSHPKYTLQLERLMRLSSDLGVDPGNWFLIQNKAGADMIPTATIAHNLGMQVFSHFSALPIYKDGETNFFLPVSRKEQDQIKQAGAIISSIREDVYV